MALDFALVSDLMSALARFRASNSPSAIPSGAGKALEAWLLMRLASAAAGSGRWEVSLRRADGSLMPTGATFQLPAGQSGIPPSSVSGPCHARLRRLRDGLSLELHGGLQWLGRSGATHECDVSVLPSTIADALRTSGGGHPRGLPVAAYECKDRMGTGGTDEMRQKVSRLFDLVLVTRSSSSGSCRIYPSTAPRPTWGRRSSQYRSFFATGVFGVVRVGGFSSGADQLGRHYHVKMHGDVYDLPLTIIEIEAGWMRALDFIDDMI